MSADGAYFSHPNPAPYGTVLPAHVKIIGASSTFVLVKLDDGALEGPLGVKFRKQP